MPSRPGAAVPEGLIRESFALDFRMGPVLDIVRHPVTRTPLAGDPMWPRPLAGWQRMLRLGFFGAWTRAGTAGAALSGRRLLQFRLKIAIIP